MDRIRVIMIRESLDNLPEHDLPSGYHLRTFRRGEERAWAEVQHSAGAFETIEKALEDFEREFAPRLDEFESRCILVVDDSTDKVVGATTAWYEREFQGLEWGMIHWVAVTPEYQGRKLAKPMLAAAMRRLKESHVRAFLRTNTGCERAISMYLDFGFVPVRLTDRFEEAWGYLAEATGHPALAEFRA